ncbi:MAG: hypothetical protein L0Z47_08520 [Actinobacteria bacterium]|nr:hypothetical protein [Actinomycetota bacterium]
MIILITYPEVKRLHQDRVRRSLARYEQTRRPDPPAEIPANVIELAFGTHCECEESVGA